MFMIVVKIQKKDNEVPLYYLRSAEQKLVTSKGVQGRRNGGQSTRA